MGQTIKFIEPYESILKELKIKQRFIREIRLCCKRKRLSISSKIESLNTKPNWFMFVWSAFDWRWSLHGVLYWGDIANRFK